jgi:hypothetical protein
MGSVDFFYPGIGEDETRDLYLWAGKSPGPCGTSGEVCKTTGFRFSRRSTVTET